MRTFPGNLLLVILASMLATIRGFFERGCVEIIV
jgi:hypothetical protein